MDTLVSNLSKLKIEQYDTHYETGDPTSFVGYVFDELMTRHKGSRDHPEQPERIKTIHTHLLKSGLLEQTCNLECRPATFPELTLCHSNEMVDMIFAFESDSRLKGAPASEHAEENFLVSRPPRDSILIDPDTYVCHSSPEAARLAAGALLQLADHIMNPESPVKRGFAAIRPPGHHATPTTPMGFCLFNNVAVAARYFQQTHGLGKICIIDWDVHHGNGTQDAFYCDASVLFISTHRYDKGLYYPKSGHLKNIGAGEGVGYTVNIPIDGSYGDDDLDYIFEYVVTPMLTQFRPEAIIISAGFDAARNDPIGLCDVSPTFFGKLTDRVLNWAEASPDCQGRLLLALEGGYDLSNIAHASEACIRSLLKLPAAPEEELLSDRTVATTVRSTQPGVPRAHVVSVCHRVTSLLASAGVDVPVSVTKLKKLKMAYSPQIAPIDIRPLVTSGGGHKGSISRSLVHPDCIKKETTIAEAIFYLSMNASIPVEYDDEDDKATSALKTLLKVEGAVVLRPWMAGCRHIRVLKGGQRAELLLDDITHGMEHPCVFDIKMGETYANPNDPLARKQAMEEKALTCSAAEYGFRLTACQAVDLKLEKLHAKRMITDAHFINTFRRFATYHFESDIICKRVSEICTELMVVFEAQSSFWFVSSSLLIAYDASCPTALPRVKIVDFAHAHPLGAVKRRDSGFIKGLTSLTALWHRSALGPVDSDIE
jgi:acetoin utilization deacetylase AcuC-like enzyme